MFRQEIPGEEAPFQRAEQTQEPHHLRPQQLSGEHLLQGQQRGGQQVQYHCTSQSGDTSGSATPQKEPLQGNFRYILNLKYISHCLDTRI